MIQRRYSNPETKTLKPKFYNPVLAQYFNFTIDTTSHECPDPSDPSGPDLTTPGLIQIDGSSMEISLVNSPSGPITLTGTIQPDGSFQVSVGPFVDTIPPSCTIFTTVQITGTFTGSALSGTVLVTNDLDNSDPGCAGNPCPDPYQASGTISAIPA